MVQPTHPPTIGPLVQRLRSAGKHCFYRHDFPKSKESPLGSNGRDPSWPHLSSKRRSEPLNSICPPSVNAEDNYRLEGRGELNGSRIGPRDKIRVNSGQTSNRRCRLPHVWWALTLTRSFSDLSHSGFIGVMGRRPGPMGGPKLIYWAVFLKPWGGAHQRGAWGGGFMWQD